MPTEATTVEAGCAYFVRMIPRWATAQWRRHGHAVDLDVYLDAGYDALTRKLATYDPTRGASFRTYAYRNIVGAIQDARKQYVRWWLGRDRGVNGYRSAEVIRR